MTRSAPLSAGFAAERIDKVCAAFPDGIAVDQASARGRRLVRVGHDADLDAVHLHDGRAGLVRRQAGACHGHAEAAHQFDSTHDAGLARIDHVVVREPGDVEAGVADGGRQGVRRIEDGVSHVIAVALERGLHVAQRQIRVLDVLLDIGIVPAEVVHACRRVISGLILRRMAHDVAHRADGQMDGFRNRFLGYRVLVEDLRLRLRGQRPEQDAGKDDGKQHEAGQKHSAPVDLYSFFLSGVSSHTLFRNDFPRTDTG